MEIDAEWLEECRMFWLWRDIGKKSRVNDPFA
jgi:hypothetical protein